MENRKDHEMTGALRGGRWRIGALRGATFSGLLLCMAALLAGCSEKNITPIASAPDNMGSITLGKTRIGAGQTIGATCDIPTGGAEIDRVTYSWVLDQGIPAEVTPKDGKSAVTFTAPTSAGEHSVTFSAAYLFLTPDKDGQISKTLTTTKTFTVVPCDVRTSFWGDDVAETLVQVPALQKVQDDDGYNGEIYEAELPDQLSLNHINPDNIPVRYIFSSGKLVKVIERNDKTFDTPRAYFSNYEIIRSCIVKSVYKYGDPVSENVTRIPEGSTPVTEPLNYSALTTEDKVLLGSGLAAGTVRFDNVLFRNASAGSGKTEISVSVYRLEDDGTGAAKVNYLRAYYPAQ